MTRIARIKTDYLEVQRIISVIPQLSSPSVSSAVQCSDSDCCGPNGLVKFSSNGNLTTIMFLSTRTDPVQKVELAARRAPGEKISRVEISSPLPKPEEAGE
jgi:hypothetical protein